MRWKICAAILVMLFTSFLPASSLCCQDSEPSVNIMHPAESNLYIGYRDIYLNINMPFALIIGSVIYRFLYGIWIVTNTVVEKVEVYVDGKLIKVATEPDEKWEDTYEWKFNWCMPGYHKIKVIAYDATMKRAAVDERELLAI